MVVPLAFLMRMGLREGFLSWELLGIGVACGLILAFPVLAMPTGFAALVVVVALIVQRAVTASRSGDVAAPKAALA